jgi:hypothetical protein
MAHLYSNNYQLGGTGNFAGISVKPDGATVAVEVPIPSVVTNVNRKPVMVRYKRRVYIVGQFSRPLVYNEYGNLVEGGIRAPASAPTLTASTYSGGSEGLVFGYLSYAHMKGGKILQESSLSAPSAMFTSTGSGFHWEGFSTINIDPRVTHIFGYRSVDGSIPARAWTRTIGVTSVDENTSTSALGPVAPVKLGLNNVAVYDPHARDVPPYTLFAEQYHDCMFYFGDPLHPERIYYSKRYEPESVNSTPVTVAGKEVKPWLETVDGEPVVGGKRHGDELILGCPTAFYAIQGYGENDWSIRKVSNYYGLLNHFSLAWCGPASDLWFASQEGVVYYDGQFHHAMLNVREFWRNEYRAHKANYERCYGAEDRYSMGYKLLIPQDPVPDPDDPETILYTPSFYWYGHYEPTQRGEQPTWVTDYRTREDSVLGLLRDDYGDTRQDLHTGSCDGIVRKENVPTDADDDGDAYGKTMTLVFPHRYVEGQSGDDAHALSFTDLNLFVKNEDQDVTVKIWGGDDTASESPAPQRTLPLPAGRVTEPRPLVAGTQTHIALAEVGGAGVTIGIEVVSPVDVQIRGYGIDYKEGVAERLPSI